MKKNNYKFPKFFLIILSLVLIWGLDKKSYLNWLRRPIETVVSQVRQKTYQPAPVNQVSELSRQLVALEAELTSLKAENQRLRELMGTNPPLDWDFALAHVIGLVDNELILDIGLDQGVKINHPVVLDDNLIGIITQTGTLTSRARLTSRPGFQLPAMIKASVVTGLVRGRGGGAIFDQVLSQYNLAVGQLVVTSGQTSWPGLIIGQIDQVSKAESAVYQSASLKLFWRPDSLDTVFVVK